MFVPGLLNEEQISTLVEAFGPQSLTVIGFPGSTPLDRLAELGVARISYGPQPLRVALTALQELAEDIYAVAVSRSARGNTWRSWRRGFPRTSGETDGWRAMLHQPA